MSLDELREVADTVLYEGYVLYPYRASAAKNRSRWQFGVLMPPAYAAVDPVELTASQTECVLEELGAASLKVFLRFLQIQRREVEVCDPATGEYGAVAQLEVDGMITVPWDEAVEHEVVFEAGRGGELAVHVDGGEEITQVGDSGRVVRRREALDLLLAVSVDPLPGPWGALRMRLRVENQTALADRPADRRAALPSALVAAHCIVVAEGARFLSMVDPPEWAAAGVASCVNVGTWPVLGGEPELLLSSPIILYDDPQLAPESPGDLYDSTEIDEILSLRTMTLTDAEKDEARATDPRAAALIDRTDQLDADAFDRMHGTMRALTAQASPAAGPLSIDDPYSDLFDEKEEAVMVAGVRLGAGSVVRLRPGSRRADAQDMFLADREAVVEAVLRDVEDRAYLAVSLRDDPALDLKRDHGRFLYFSPDEVEPCGAGPEGGSR